MFTCRGCPPRPEQIIEGVMKIQELARSESARRREMPEYQNYLNPIILINSMPNHEEVLKELKAQFGDKIQSFKTDVGTLIIDLESGDHAYNVLNYLQNDSTLKLNFLTTLCGLHFPDQSGAELGVMYQVKNLVTGYSLRLNHISQ